MHSQCCRYRHHYLLYMNVRVFSPVYCIQRPVSTWIRQSTKDPTFASSHIHLLVFFLIFVFSKSFWRERSKAARASFHLFTTWMFLSLFSCPTIVAIQRTLVIHGFLSTGRGSWLDYTYSKCVSCNAKYMYPFFVPYFGPLQAIYVLPPPSGAYDTCLGAYLLSGFSTHLVGWLGDNKCFYRIFLFLFTVPFPESVSLFVCSLGWIRGVQANRIGGKKGRKETRMYG
ncbi:hypothetical protein DM02DRAFT_47427 [Periconia macrospinosa]|uniref:Uncharacterized protein n=1 Tax=Periconia macrospinosa TaxID=97972 RepID=A0A2V1DKF7_9PLEO|nr:hypothetical protein DM02DRAFT_47427 [Periconia macrospinosa]